MPSVRDGDCQYRISEPINGEKTKEEYCRHLREKREAWVRNSIDGIKAHIKATYLDAGFSYERKSDFAMAILAHN